MSYIQNFFTSRDNNANAETYVGQEGRLWWDPTTNQIYSSDGNTPGGIPLAGGGGGNGTPGGSNSQVQFNQNGTFGGSANLTFNSATGALTAVSFAGNGAGLTSITGANITGTVANATYATTTATVTDAAQPNITSVGTLTSIVSSGNISTTGNVTSNYFLGNGSQLTGIAAGYGNANVVANLAALGSNPISTTGNVTAGYLLGNGSALTSITGANVTGTVANATYADTANASTYAFNLNGGTAGALVAQNGAGATGFITIAAANTILVSNGSNPAWTLPGSIAVGTVTANAQPNITSVGTLTSVTVTGNVTGGNLLTGGIISSTGNITSGNLNAAGLSLSGNVVSAINTTANITTTANISGGNVVGTTSVAVDGTGGNLTMTGGAITGAGSITSTGNITGSNLIGTLVGNLTGTTAGLSGNITGGNVLSNGQLSAAGNITGGNISIGGNFTTPGNIGASYINGAYYTGTWSTNFQVLGNISTVANVISGNILTSGLISATGNVTGGNIISTGAVYSNYNTNTANTASFMAQGGNTKGGTGYLDFLVAQNTSGGATVPYKWLRTTSDGQLQIINSAYTQNIFNLTDAGNVAIPGQIFINGAQTTNGPAFSAYAAAILQTIPNNAQTKVLFQTEEFDTNSNYTNSRFTPTVAGYYQLNAEVRLDGSSGTGEMMIILYKNGAEYKRGTNQSGTQIATNFWAMQVSSVAYANGLGDYFEIYVQQGSGGSISVTAVNNSAITWFNGCMLRGA